MIACWKYEIGVVLTLERHDSLPPGLGMEIPCPNVGLSMIGETTYFPGARAALRRIYTAPGDELRTLSRLAVRPEVLAASLNYWGSPTDSTVEIANWQQKHISVPMSSAVFFSYDPPNKIRCQDVFDGGVTRPIATERDQSKERLRVVVIDGEFKHGCQVAEAVREGYSAFQGGCTSSFDILVFTLKSHATGAFDLWTFCNLLLASTEVQSPISVIAIAVDLGRLCANPETLSQPGTPWVGSLELFEICLDLCLHAHSLRNSPPLLVGAAGNRLGSSPGCRLAYPSSLPDVIAVTSARFDTAGVVSLSPSVEVPAVGPMKPCFGTSRTEALESEFASTTSEATGLLSGAIAAWDEQRDWEKSEKTKLGQLAKLATLLKFTDSHPVSQVAGQSLPDWPPKIEVLELTRGQITEDQTSEIQELLSSLGSSFGREFVLTGSAAFIDNWLRVNDIYSEGEWPRAYELISDWDLIYTGLEARRLSKATLHSNLPDINRNQVEEEIARWWDGVRLPAGQLDLSHKAQLRHLRDGPGRLLWLQCNIPAAQIVLTTHGQIGSLGGRAESTSGKWLKIHVPQASVWQANQQWRAGKAGVLDGALVTLNLVILTIRLQEIFKKEEIDFDALAGVLRKPASLLPEKSESERVATESIRSTHWWYGLGSDQPGPWARRRIRLIRRRIQQLAEESLRKDAEDLLDLLSSWPREATS